MRFGRSARIHIERHVEFAEGIADYFVVFIDNLLRRNAFFLSPNGNGHAVLVGAADKFNVAVLGAQVAHVNIGRQIHARQVPDVPCPWLDGLFVNSGHGSRGLITAPLAAQLLAAWLDDDPLPVPKDVAQACHPNRFALRALVRGKA